MEKMDYKTHPINQYAEKVLNGTILACKWVHLACERHKNDLATGHTRGLHFDYEAADHALEFFSYLKLWKGSEYKGKEFVLAPHYQFIIGSIFGWKNANGTRRFRTAYNEMARKGMKTTVAGGIGAYMFVADGEDGAEIYTAAVKRDQARFVWTNIRNLLKKSIFAKLITFHKDNLSIERSWSKCEPLSSDSKSLDGLDTHYASLDELHAHPTPDVHDLITDSTGARAQSLILIITTAGFDQSGICYQRREYLTKILKGTIQDDSFFGIIYTLDTAKDWPDIPNEDNWQDEDVWVKAMPALCGITKSGQRFGVDTDGNPVPGYATKLDDVRKAAIYASEIPAAQNNFLTKRLNIWTQQATRWIDLKLWDDNHTREISEQSLTGRSCVGGVDLSSVMDLTVWCMAFPDDNDPELIDILIRVWCPEARLFDTKNKYRTQYQSWAQQGYLQTTEGDAIDYDFVRAQIVEDARRFKIESVGVDRLFQGYEFSMKLDSELGGHEKSPKVIACGMGFLSMAGPCQELERRLLERKINHGGNPILRFMADNVSVKTDPAGNRKPDKASSQGKIDGIIGILLCLDRLLRTKPRSKIRLPEII